MKPLLSSTTILLLLLAMLVPTNAQQFLRVTTDNYGGSIYYGVDVLNNGNYVCTGMRFTLPSNSETQMIAAIYSPTGRLIRRMNTTGIYDVGYAVKATTDGGFAVVGKTYNSTYPVVSDSSKLMFTRYNVNGDPLWSYTYSGQTEQPTEARDLIQLADGGFFVVGSATTSSVNPAYKGDMFLLRTDAAGNELWQLHYGDTLIQETPYSVTQTNDGNLVVSGHVTQPYTSGPSYGFALKLDTLGNVIWYKKYRFLDLDVDPMIVETNTGELLVNGTSNFRAALLRLNAQGDSIEIIPTHNNNGTYTSKSNDLIVNPDGSIVITGRDVFDSTGVHIWIKKLDTQLDSVWSRTLTNAYTSNGNAITRAPDGGYAIAGRWSTPASFEVIAKTDSLGNLLESYVTGTLINDLNGNCSHDVGEDTVLNGIVKASLNGVDYYSITNSQGQYNIVAYDTGVAQISTDHASTFWDQPGCQNTATILFASRDTARKNVYLTPDTYCPLLTVKLHNNVWRRCFSNNMYTVSYFNNGSVGANNVYVDVDLGQLQTIDSSSIAWVTPVVNGIYKFNIGNLGVGDLGSFRIWTSTDCNDLVLGQCVCAEAHIYPDSICEPVNPAWDLSSISIQSECLAGDTISFTLTNNGSADMSGPLNYSIIRNNTLITRTPYQLKAAESLTILIPGDGATYAMVSAQSPGHPGLSDPLRVVEGCGTKFNGTIDVGYLMQFPQDDKNPFVDILCGPIVGSFDPNNKLVEPLGVSASGNINADQVLDYTINFQNTGTDTAFLVVLRDTLSPYLDIATLQLTASSHNYTFQIYEGHILEWTFENILLPDSNVNEQESHGFVGFSIDQIDNNPVGTEILNRAGIYFDFNEVVLTNYTTNTIVEDYKDGFTVSITEVDGKANSVSLYPNPNSGSFYIKLQKPNDGVAALTVFDLAGKTILTREITGSEPNLVELPNLDSGIYFYNIVQGNENISNGKVLITE